MYIIIEGVDGVGKTTLLEGLRDYILKTAPPPPEKLGYPIINTLCEPPKHTALGKAIRFLINNDDSNEFTPLDYYDLFWLARERGIFPIIARHYRNVTSWDGFIPVILQDRCYISSYVYQLGSIDGLMEEVENCLKQFEDFPFFNEEDYIGPDMVIVLDANEDVIKERLIKRQENIKRVEIEKLPERLKLYRELSSQLPFVYLIDANRPPEEVLKDAINLYNNYREIALAEWKGDYRELLSYYFHKYHQGSII